MYEARGPHTALYIECLTDNRNRAASEVRLAVTRNGGTMADQGSVAFLFERKGVAEVTKTDGLTEDDVLMAVLDAGAEEVLDEGDVFTVVSAATDLPEIRKALDEAGLQYNNDDPVFRPTMQVDLDADGAKKFLSWQTLLKSSTTFRTSTRTLTFLLRSWQSWKLSNHS